MKIEEFKSGIFALPFRRFGAFTQLMIQEMYQLDEPKNNFHDLYDSKSNERVEVKFCVVRSKWKSPINRKNVMKAIQEANKEGRVLKMKHRKTQRFDCNINQVKPAEFEVLYYGLFFYDGVLVYKIRQEMIGPKVMYSNRQHKGNIGEGQFHINNRTFDLHNPFFRKGLLYQDIFSMMNHQGGNNEKSMATETNQPKSVCI